MPSHPDFICIGSQKAGTGWLYDQAKTHPGAWMPPIKEVHYLTSSRGLGALKVKSARRLQNRFGDGAEVPPEERRDYEFLRRASEINAKGEPNLAEYASLFEPAGELTTGDISPGYYKLKKNDIAEVAKGLPKCRFPFLLREPVGRWWSQVNMKVRHGVVDAVILSDAVAFEKYTRLVAASTPSFQSEVIMRWRKVVGEDRFRVFLMDDLIADPEGYRRAVFGFVGLDGDLCTVEAGSNSKASLAKDTVPEAHRAFLTGFFSEERAKLMRLVPAAEAAWSAKQAA
jgi:hypothetical protein